MAALAHSLTVAGSVALHAGLFWLGTGASGRPHTAALDQRGASIAIDLEENAADTAVAPAPDPPAASHEPAAATQKFRSSFSRPASAPAAVAPGAAAPVLGSPAAASLPARSPASVAAAPLLAMPVTAPAALAALSTPRFTLFGAMTPHEAKTPALTGDALGGAPQTVIWDARDVSEPARLLASTPASYPESASAGGIEADVALELVVDERGRVASARARRSTTDAFERAALDAVHGYRFSPARRAGRPVRVRMNWTVHFRLR